MSAASRWSSLQCIVFFRFSLGELIVTDCNVSMSPVQRYSCSVNCVTTPRPRFGRSTTHASSQSHHFNVYKMQLVLNLGFRDHVTPALQQLHWLPVEHSINTTYKLCAVHWCTRSLKLSGNEFLQADGPATEKARRPYTFATGEMTRKYCRSRRLADLRCCRETTSVVGDWYRQRSTKYTAALDLAYRQLYMYHHSVSHCVVTAIGLGRTCVCRWSYTSRSIHHSLKLLTPID